MRHELLKQIHRPIFFALVLSSVLAPACFAQSLGSTPAPAGLPSVPVSLEERRAALLQVERDYWENLLKHSPELASLLGDGKYNDRLTVFTAAAYNEALGREQSYLLQLAVIDPAGLTNGEADRLGALNQRFEQDQRDAALKPWQTPITSAASFVETYPVLATVLPFSTAKDYEDWTARLRALPEAIDQATEAMTIGIEEGRTPSRQVVERAIEEVSALTGHKPEESLLASPLAAFPSGVSEIDRERIREEMLGVIGKQVQPAYLRLEHFLKASYLPASGRGRVSDGTQEAQLLAAVLDLRDRAWKSLGPKFSPAAFSAEVRLEAPLPIPAFEERLDAWIRAQGGTR